MKKNIVVFIIILLVAGISIYICKDELFKKEKIKQVPQSLERVVKLFKVQSVNQKSGVTYPGTVKALRHADLFFRVSGPVIERNLKKGQTIKAGQVLMKIDPRDYQREVDTLTQQLTASREKTKLDETDHSRAKKLYEEAAISKSTYDAALTKKNVSEAQTKSLEESLKKAKDKLADTVLRAPFEGTITELRIEQHEIAVAGAPIVALDDLREVEIKINIPAGNLPNISIKDKERIIGMEFNVTFPGRGDRIVKAAIYEFKPVASDNSETFEVLLKLKVPDNFLVLPGMSVEVHDVPNISSKSIHKNINIPYASVFKRNDKTLVWVVDLNTKKASMREIEMKKPVETDKVEILSGLQDGEFIIAAGADWFNEENTVKIMNPEVLNENR